MSDFDNRYEERKRVCVQAFVSDANDTFNIKCIIRDISGTGCMIITSQIHELPDFVQLIPERFDQPLWGKIMWRNDKMAGISFLSRASKESLSLLHDCPSSAICEGDDDEPLLLGNTVRPMSYAERLASYVPPKK